MSFLFLCFPGCFTLRRGIKFPGRQTRWGSFNKKFFDFITQHSLFITVASLVLAFSRFVLAVSITEDAFNRLKILDWRQKDGKTKEATNHAKWKPFWKRPDHVLTWKALLTSGMASDHTPYYFFLQNQASLMGKTSGFTQIEAIP